MPKQPKSDPAQKKVYMGSSWGSRRVCSEDGNKMFAPKWVNGRVTCPGCGSYCLKRVYLNYYKDLMFPSLAKGRRCASLTCHNCKTSFQMVIECHPDCKHMVDCLTGIVNVQFKEKIKKGVTP